MTGEARGYRNAKADMQLSRMIGRDVKWLRSRLARHDLKSAVLTSRAMAAMIRAFSSGRGLR